MIPRVLINDLEQSGILGANIFLLAVLREHRSNDGRPLFDAVMVCEVVIFQAVQTLSDDRVEYLTNG